jgi:hypothetical protein
LEVVEEERARRMVEMDMRTLSNHMVRRRVAR